MVAICAIVVATKVSSARENRIGLPATAEQRAIMSRAVADEEPAWRKSTDEEFPADLWSQRDAFHGHEANKVRDMSFAHRVPIEDVLRAIDDDIHKNRDRERLARAIPCKPRPFYD